VDWAGYSIGTSILRETAGMTRRMVAIATETRRLNFISMMGWDFTGDREVYIDRAMARLEELREMPVTLSSTMILQSIWLGPNDSNLNNFMAGVITAEAFAQIIHNAVSLWLME
jgi:hypothetical protein